MPRAVFKYIMIKLTSVKNSKNLSLATNSEVSIDTVRNTLNRCYRGNAGPMKKLNSLLDLKRILQISYTSQG